MCDRCLSRDNRKVSAAPRELLLAFFRSNLVFYFGRDRWRPDCTIPRRQKPCLAGRNPGQPEVLRVDVLGAFCDLPSLVRGWKAPHGEMNDAPDREVVIFTEALRLPAAERAGYLDRACPGDGELR